MQTYLKNGYIVSMDQQDTVFDGGGVLVEDDRITAVGKVDPRLVKPDAEVIDLQGKSVTRRYVDFVMNTDERIVDGFYYATVMKYFEKLLREPEQLDLPPEEVLRDIP